MKLKHFTHLEFACPCCGAEAMDEEFLAMLDLARELAGVPFVVNSGFRCPARNRAVGGAPHSAHLTGHAADIRCADSGSRFRMLTALLAAGFKRIGTGPDFLHADNDPRLPQNRIWDYRR